MFSLKHLTDDEVISTTERCSKTFQKDVLAVI
jgi:hypothetical protein